MNSIDDKVKHSFHRKKMRDDKVKRLEEKGYTPKPLEEEYKRKRMRALDYDIEAGDLDEDL